MKFMNVFVRWGTICFFLSVFNTSCKVPHTLDSSTDIRVPASFTGTTDTSGIGDIPVHDFFTDSNLVAIIDTALKNNPDLLSAMQRVEIARAGFTQSKGALLPAVSAGASAGVEKYGDYTMNGVGNFDTNLSHNLKSDQRIPNPTPDFFIGFQSFWEIDLWGKLRNRRKAAYARYLASEKGQQLVVTTLVSEIARTYYQLLALDSKLGILQQNIRLQETGLEIVNIQKAAGRVTELAVEQFTAQLLSTRSKEAEIQQLITETENRLNFLAGRFPQPVFRSGSINDQQLPASVSAGIPSEMLLRRPDIRQAALELAATKADAEAARLSFLPSLTLTPRAGLNAFNAALLANPASLAAALYSGFYAPVFNRRALKAGLRTATARKQQAVYDYRKSVLLGYQEVVTSLKGIDNYEKVYKLKKEQANVLGEAVSTSNDLFLSGYASYLEVITAQKNVLEAELELVNARQIQFSMLINLYRSLGGGWK